MQVMEKIMEEVLAIEDPNKAYVTLAMHTELSLDEGEKILEAYMEKHNVSQDEMAFYPNGERVLRMEMFW